MDYVWWQYLYYSNSEIKPNSRFRTKTFHICRQFWNKMTHHCSKPILVWTWTQPETSWCFCSNKLPRTYSQLTFGSSFFKIFLMRIAAIPVRLIIFGLRSTLDSQVVSTAYKFKDKLLARQVEMQELIRWGVRKMENYKEIFYNVILTLTQCNFSFHLSSLISNVPLQIESLLDLYCAPNGPAVCWCWYIHKYKS